jgi:hypothetical protein
MTASRETKILAGRLARDHAAGIEDPGYDGRVHFKHVTFKNAGAVHHWHAGNANIVLDRHRLVGEHARAAAFDIRLPVPCVELVLLGCGPIARQAGILYVELRFREFVEARIGGHGSGHQASKRGGVVLIEMHAIIFRDVENLLDRR